MDPPIVRGLNDKLYERRKAAALELEKLVLSSDLPRITQIIDQLCAMFSSTSSALHTRNGGLIGLAATAIALGQDVAPFLGTIVPPVLACFSDPESRVRYYSCESLYNIAKVSKGEILVYFNEVFDALSKLAADSELSVKNGAELLDRLLKDIVAEAAPHYISQYPHQPTSSHQANDDQVDHRAFSLSRFVPLLSERIYVISPFTRMHLVSWIMVLDSVPDLELVSYLPDFLDGLLKYLSDPNVDVRTATENVLAEFLREIRDIAKVQQRQQQHTRSYSHSQERSISPNRHRLVKNDIDEEAVDDGLLDDAESLQDEGVWIPGQGVFVDHAAIVEIMIHHLSYPDEQIQAIAMHWITTFLTFALDVVVPFTPQLVPAILPNLAHHVPAIQSAANETNSALYHVIQALPLPMATAPSTATTAQPLTSIVQPATASSSLQSLAGSPPMTAGFHRRNEQSIPDASEVKTVISDPLDIGSTGNGAPPSRQTSLNITTSLSASNVQTVKAKNATLPVPIVSEPTTPATLEFPTHAANRRESRPHSPTASVHPTLPQHGHAQPIEEDPFDIKVTVNVLTLQFLSEHEDTRVAALEWLLMLHQKAPNKTLSRDDGTFPALLKTLSDPSEEVVKYDLQLLAQISSSSEDSYFTSFMVNVLELFSTDRRLLETRGSLIIRQLCINLNTERIYRTLAEILEKDEDLEFASLMVVKLNMILITSPELLDFRKRLKNLDSKDGQMLFSSLYKSWCHNAVAVFALCLLAQAYEHASNLLQIFAELELTVSLLVQIDKLVMLIESPVFTTLRLQLLEPDKHPYLPKCLYGLLMILPQSSAFVSLRARLSIVHSSGYVPTPPKTSNAYPASTPSSRSKISSRDEIKWQELLSHFRNVQHRHEKSRRAQIGDNGQSGSISGFHVPITSNTLGVAPGSRDVSGSGPKTGTVRRKGTGSAGKQLDSIRSSLSPLNSKRGSGSGMLSAGVSIGGAVASMNGAAGLGSLRAASPPGRRKILPGIRRSGQ